ncbi:MAG: hypothetical protein ABJC89_07710 [Acidobacteriota bacterium]
MSAARVAVNTAIVETTTPAAPSASMSLRDEAAIQGRGGYIGGILSGAGGIRLQWFFRLKVEATNLQGELVRLKAEAGNAAVGSSSS